MQSSMIFSATLLTLTTDISLRKSRHTPHPMGKLKQLSRDARLGYW